jgi:hypothetical protein
VLPLSLSLSPTTAVIVMEDSVEQRSNSDTRSSTTSGFALQTQRLLSISRNLPISFHLLFTLFQFTDAIRAVSLELFAHNQKVNQSNALSLSLSSLALF